MDSETEELWRKIKQAREHLTRVQNGRAMLANALASTPGLASVEIEFPEPDTAHVYQGMFGRRVGEPLVTYQLSFNPLKWVATSRIWDRKPADIAVGPEGEDA